MHFMRKDKAWLVANASVAISADDTCKYADLITRRLTGEPIQYITGQTEFFGLPFRVTPDVLIPRPETEHLVEEVLRLSAQFTQKPIRIADVGTGSGVIAIALAHLLPESKIAATDLSSRALKIAIRNAQLNQVADRVMFHEGDLLAPLSGQSFHILASNPPYVPLSDRDSLSVEVRDYEPPTALFAGEEGLAIYRRLIPGARQFLTPNGWLVLEIGYGQQPAIEELLQLHSCRDIHFMRDYQGIPRVVSARCN